MVVEVQNSSEIEDTGTNENVNEIIETIEEVESVKFCSSSANDVEEASNDANESVNQPKGNDVIAECGRKP